MYFREKFLGGNDIHTVVRDFDSEKQVFFLRAYLNSLAKLKVRGWRERKIWCEGRSGLAKEAAGRTVGRKATSSLSLLSLFL